MKATLCRRLSGQGLGARLATGAFWSMASAVAWRGFQMIAFVLLARILEKDNYGKLGMIQATTSMFGTLAGFGMGVTATKFVAEYREKEPQRAADIWILSEGISILFGTIIALALFCLAPWLSANVLSAPDLSNTLRISAPLLVFGTISGVQTGTLVGLESFRSLASISLWGGVLGLPVMVLPALGWGLNGAVIGIVVSQLINCVLGIVWLRIEAARFNLTRDWKRSLSEWPLLLSFSLPALLSSMTVSAANWSTSAILVNQSNGYEEMGIYNAVNNWFIALMFFPMYICRPVLPILSETLSGHDAEGARRVLRLSIQSLLLGYLPVLIGIGVISPWIMALYGSGFRSAWPALMVTLAASATFILHLPVGNLIQGAGKMWIGFLTNAGWAILFVVFAYVLVSLGAMGICEARLGAYLVHTLWTAACGFMVLHQCANVRCARNDSVSSID